MSITDTSYVITWWLWIFVIGTVFLPLASVIFKNFTDKGYIFAKTLGIIFVSYGMFLLGTFHALSFSRLSISLLLLLPIIITAITLIKRKTPLRLNKQLGKSLLKIFIFEEALFLVGLFFLSYIRGFAPDIHGLEKYMDFGFINSIQRAEFFPPKDMWLTPETINYYYFGHLTTAVLTILTGIPSFVTYNLMLATIFSFCLTSSFSLGFNLLTHFQQSRRFFTKSAFFAGILAACIVTLGGNLHTIYTFFKPYENEKPVPVWELSLSPSTFPNAYWYPNATRYIYNTIHEFPIYSWTVSDLHGHVLDIPFVLLTVAILFAYFQRSQLPIEKSQTKNGQKKLFSLRRQLLDANILYPLLIGFLLAIMYMTNAWDGIIYFLLSVFVIFYVQRNKLDLASVRFSIKSVITNIRQNRDYLFNTLYSVLLVGLSLLIFAQPFTRFFKPFVSGVGILCAPQFLTKMGSFGSLLFEADHCQHSPWWQLIILYGFFYFFVFSFLLFLFKYRNGKRSDAFVLILIGLSTLLIIIPEFIYAKDIYPAHYRANTMFKLVFQSFMLLGICSGYIIVRVIHNIKKQYYTFRLRRKILAVTYILLTTVFLTLIFIYPYLAIMSYYGELKTYSGLDGTKYLGKLYPSDYKAIQWINKNIQGQPVILEAQGDSYTDYARVSANTGLPTVLGWTVHEWLWRGTYDIPAPRIDEVTSLYESQSPVAALTLLRKYNVSYVFVGDMERQKYPKLYETKFEDIGTVVYKNGKTKIYKINL